MNLLYCGDSNILNGLTISLLSIIKNTTKDLNVYILTMKYKNNKKEYMPINKEVIEKLEKELKKKRDNIKLTLIDVKDLVEKYPLTANENNMKFTPYCMLRLYADLIKELPKKILYLDTDTVSLKDISTLYDIDIDNYEVAGVLDNYGQHFFRTNIIKKEYLNSGVLLLNLDNIRKNNVFSKCRNYCNKYPMVMPDQSSLNKFAKHKLFLDRKYNEQKEIQEDTIIRHFTTTFKFWPTFHTQTIKPWHIDKLHDVLNTHEFDDVLEEYQQLKGKLQ